LISYFIGGSFTKSKKSISALDVSQYK